MEYLLLDSISEKLSAIDQKSTEMVKTTGETNRSIDQIRSRIAAMESKVKSAVNPVQQFYPLPAEPINHQVAWSKTSARKMGLILIPILSALRGDGFTQFCPDGWTSDIVANSIFAIIKSEHPDITIVYETSQRGTGT